MYILTLFIYLFSNQSFTPIRYVGAKLNYIVCKAKQKLTTFHTVLELLANETNIQI